MKLKNKKTGEIRELPDGYFCGDNLQKICEEWEDAPEEPKEWWYIDIHGPHEVTNNDEYYQQVKAASKEFGNYFETRTEAEKAVEKLKAWKRLKDKGFKFYGYNFYDILSGVINIKAEFENSSDTQIVKDLDWLFSGEDD